MSKEPQKSSNPEAKPASAPPVTPPKVEAKPAEVKPAQPAAAPGTPAAQKPAPQQQQSHRRYFPDWKNFITGVLLLRY
jgi:hypothetical protein